MSIQVDGEILHFQDNSKSVPIGNILFVTNADKERIQAIPELSNRVTELGKLSIGSVYYFTEDTASAVLAGTRTADEFRIWHRYDDMTDPIDASNVLTCTYNPDERKLTWTLTDTDGNDLSGYVNDTLIRIENASHVAVIESTLTGWHDGYSTVTLEDGDYFLYLEFISEHGNRTGEKPVDGFAFTVDTVTDTVTDWAPTGSDEYGAFVIQPDSDILLSELKVYQQDCAWGKSLVLRIKECTVDGTDVTIDSAFSDTDNVSSVTSYTKEALETSDTMKYTELIYSPSSPYTLSAGKTYIVWPIQQQNYTKVGFAVHNLHDSRVLGCVTPGFYKGLKAFVLQEVFPYMTINGVLY